MKYFSRAHNKGENLRPPDLYEYFIDNFWFKTVDLENQIISEPLRGSHKTDVVIVGGGVPTTQTAGRMIADMMAGESNEFTNHYIVNRNIPYAGPIQLRGFFARCAKWMLGRLD